MYVIFIFQPENTIFMDSLFAALEMFACMGHSVDGLWVVFLSACCLKLRATRCLLSCSGLQWSKLMDVSLKRSNHQLLRSGREFTPHYPPTMQMHLRIPIDSFFVGSDLVSHWQLSFLYPSLLTLAVWRTSVARKRSSCKFSNVGYYFLFYTSLLGIHALHFPDWDLANILQNILQHLF